MALISPSMTLGRAPEIFEAGTDRPCLTHIAGPIALHRILGLIYVGRGFRPVPPCAFPKNPPHHPLSRCLLRRPSSRLTKRHPDPSFHQSSYHKLVSAFYLFCEVRIDRHQCRSSDRGRNGRIYNGSIVFMTVHLMTTDLGCIPDSRPLN